MEVSDLWEGCEAGVVGGGWVFGRGEAVVGKGGAVGGCEECGCQGGWGVGG